jgi:hypothetical protein
MTKTVGRWIFVLVALFAVGPALAGWVGGVRAVDGSHAASLLVSQSPTTGAIRGAVLLALAGVFAVAGTIGFGRDTGMLGAGVIVAWVAWGMGSTESILRLSGSGAPLGRLAMEGRLVGVLGIGVIAVVQIVSNRAGGQASGHSSGLLATDVESNASVPTAGAAAILGSAVAAGLLAWLVAVDASKGQAVIAAWLAAIAGAGAAQVAASFMRARATMVSVMIGLVLVAAVGPLLAQQSGGSRVVQDALAGRLFSLARPISLDWVAGGLLGIPIGLGWANSMLDRTPDGT